MPKSMHTIGPIATATIFVKVRLGFCSKTENLVEKMVQNFLTFYSKVAGVVEAAAVRPVGMTADMAVRAGADIRIMTMKNAEAEEAETRGIGTRACARSIRTTTTTMEALQCPPCRI